jgi:hypothetical protein
MTLKKSIKIFLLFTLLLVVIWIASALLKLSILLDTEEIIKWQLKNDTGLIIPEKYNVIQSYGSTFSDSVNYSFQFQEMEFEELKKNLAKTKFYNDTITLREFEDLKWDPDDKRNIFALTGIWLESDSNYYFIPLTPYDMHMQPFIELAEINKKNRTLTIIPTELKYYQYLEQRND